MPLQLQYSPLDTLTITSEPGDRATERNAEKSRPHEGMDFRASPNTNVYNAHDGKVIFASKAGSYGNVVVIQDASGYSTLYAHLNSIEVVKNQRLTGRTGIGKSGATGGNYDPHFHFEVINEEISNKIAAGVLAIEDNGRENPRDYIANSPFYFMISDDQIHSGELGIGEKTGDNKDNTFVRDPIGDYYGRPIKFSGKDGRDTYSMRLSFTGVRLIPAVDENGNPVLGSNGKQKYVKEYKPGVAASDEINDINGDGSIVINDTKLEGNANPYLDSLGNIIPNKWSLNGFDLTRSNNNLIITKAGQDPNNSNVGKITVTDFVFFKPKAFLRNIFLSLFSVVFLFSSQSFAAETKPKTAQTKQENKQQEITDPDLKLSIDELKKKYPISLLDEKKKNYKPGQKINIDDYSIAEIKAAFLNADRNFISRIPESKIPMVSAGKVDVKILNNDVKVHSQLELDIIDESCNEFTWVTGSSPKKYQIMKSFLFSWEREIPLFIYRFVPIKTQSCFDTDTGWSGEQSDPFERN